MKVLLLTGIIAIWSSSIVFSHDDDKTEFDGCMQNITSIDQIAQVLENASLNLLRISLCDNDLVTIEKNSFKRFEKLEKLNLDKNRRLKFNSDGSEFLDVNSLTDLHCFRCGVDKIYNRSLQGMPRLEQINLTENSIEQIEADAFRANKNLEKIDLRANKLKRVPLAMLSHLNNIQWIKLSKNRELAPEESKPFLISEVLETLWCDECGFVTIQENTFAKLPSLKELYLGGNKISHIHELAFSHVPLTKLMLEGNVLRSIEARILDVKTICLDYNSDELECFLKDLSDSRRFNCSSLMVAECLLPTTVQITTVIADDIAHRTTNITNMLSADDRMATRTINYSNTHIKTEITTMSNPSTSPLESVEGISDAYISGYLTLIYLAQIATFVLLVGVWLKLKKYDTDPDVDRYSESIVNPNPIYKAIH